MRWTSFITQCSSIAFDQQHKPRTVLVFRHTRDEVMPRSQEETDQEQPMLTNMPIYIKHITVLIIGVGGVCRLW